LRADVLFIRAQSTIRADGFTVRAGFGNTCALARANRVFRADEKRIRTENTVMDKSEGDCGWLLYKIVDCARMCFSSVRNRRSARTASRPRNRSTVQQDKERFELPCMAKRILS